MKKIIITSIIISAFAISANAQLKIFNAGNVTIGNTTAPASGFKMHVQGNSLFSTNSFSGNSAAFIRGLNGFSTETTPDYTWWGSDLTGLFHPDGSDIGVSTGGTERFRFFSGGINSYGNALFAETNSSVTSAAYIRGLNDYSDETTPDYTWYNNDQTGFFHPRDNTIGFTTVAKERMRITETGNLLVGGTYNGGYRVSIDAEQNLSALSTGTNFTAKYGYAHASYVNNESTKNWVVVFNNNEKFSVWGNGNVWAYNYYNYSDSILKDNIVTLSGARTKILALRGVSYNFKPQTLANLLDTTTIIVNTPPKLEIGLIAEEVEQIVPEAVATDDHGIKGVAYNNLVPLLIEAFKEQNQELQDLKSQLELCCANGGGIGLGGHRQADPLINVTTDNARLDQNIPNPFNIKTEIHFYLPENSISKSLLIFDMQGILLKQYSLNEKGESKITINGNEFRAGMYLYSLVIDGKEIDTKRMIFTN